MMANVCPCPLKRAYPTRKRALAAVAHRSAKQTLLATLRPYKCKCHAWHITSSEDRK